MDTAALTIPAGRLSRFEEAWRGPLAIVELHDLPEWPMDFRLPACPAIGIGRSDHPLAGRLDAMVETPSGLGAIVRNVMAQPAAAATLVQVLRATEGLAPTAALTVESLGYGLLQGSEGHLAWQRARRMGKARASGTVRVATCADALEITLDRPEAGNAIDRGMRDGLHDALMLGALDRKLARIRLLGRGKAFSLGADLDEFGTTSDPATAHAIRCVTLPARAALECGDRLEAHIDGACVGAGLEIVAFAARITATSRSWFQLPELAMGIIPGAGGCVSLPRRIGRQRTALLVLSGRRIGARQALDWGLIDALVDDAPGDHGGEDIA